MAMDCGHYAPLEVRLARLRENLCPPCGIPLEPHNQVMKHGFCPCCLECWVFRSEDEIVSVFHS